MRRTLVLCLIMTACSPGAPKPSSPEAPAVDSAFAALQARGRDAMGVDQYSSRHRFDDLPNGGRIELQRDSTDTAGVQTIREHLQHVSQAFADGDFSIPGFVHADSVPGTATMSARRKLIAYNFRPLPGGGEVLVTSTDSGAISAIHAFMAYQRQDHHAEGMQHSH